MTTQTSTDLKQTIQVGTIVTVIFRGHLYGHQGVVMDTNSDFEPEDGPIAVFFDEEVDAINFSNWFEVKKWKTEPPTPENYRECPRIVCFEQSDLRVETEFSIETRARKLFKGMFHCTQRFKFNLVPNAHICQFEDCCSGKNATEKTLINFWGRVIEIYACVECHKKYNGVCTEMIELKRPLPGAPA